MARTSLARKLHKDLLESWQADVAKVDIEVSGPRPTTTIHKSTAMRLVESRFGQRIEDLVSIDKSGRQVAKRLGVSNSCVAKWRKQLGLLPKRGRRPSKEIS